MNAAHQMMVIMVMLDDIGDWPGDEVVLARHEDVLLAEDVLLLLSFHYVLQSEGEDGNDWCEMIVAKMIMIIINNVLQWSL